MKKYIGMISILIGIFANIYTFYNIDFNISLLAILIVEIIGILISVFALKKYKEKILSSIGLVLNIFPLTYVALIFLFLA